MRFAVGLAAFFVLAQIPPHYLRIFTPWIYLLGIGLLLAVAVEGEIGKGAQRWLDLGVVTFQPSELLKLAVPMMCAWFMHERRLPPTFAQLMVMASHRADAGALDRRSARSRHGVARDRRRRSHDSLGRHQRARDARVRRAGCRDVAGAVVVHARLPEGTRLHVLEPRDRSARHGLQHHPIEDRDRLGRAFRQGLVERHAIGPRFSTGAVHGLHFCRDGRGARVCSACAC